MTYTEKLLKLLLRAKDLPLAIRQSLESDAENFYENFIETAGEFLHNDLDVMGNDTPMQVIALVQVVPESLSYEICHDDDTPVIPIQAALWNYSENEPNYAAIPYIPILAEEGVKNGIAENEGGRGGLLREDDAGDQVLPSLVYFDGDFENPDDNRNFDIECLALLKYLRSVDLFQREDIKRYNLLAICCNSPRMRLRTQFLIDWDPSCLFNKRDNDTHLHHLAAYCCSPSFKLVLNAALKYYPNDLGLLCVKNGKGKSVIEIAYYCFGNKRAWANIKKCLDSVDSIAILEKNPNTNMLPVMLAAADCGSSHLDLIYYLLRKSIRMNPSETLSTLM